MLTLRVMAIVGTLALLGAWLLALSIVPGFVPLYEEVSALPLSTTLVLNTYPAWGIFLLPSASLCIWLLKEKKLQTPKSIYLSVGGATLAIILGINLVALTTYGLYAPVDQLSDRLNQESTTLASP